MFNSYDWKNKFKKIYQSKNFVILISALFLFLLFFYDYDKYIYTSGYTILGKNAMGIYLISGYIFTEILCLLTSRLVGVNYFYVFIETICIACISVFVTAVLKKNKLTNQLLLGAR